MQVKDGIAWLWRVSGKFRPHILCAGLIGMARVAVSLGSVWICKEIIDNVTGQSDGRLGFLIALMIGCMVLRMVLSLAGGRLSRKTEARLTNQMRHDLFGHLMRSRWDGHQSQHSGDILNRMIDDVTTVSGILCGGVPVIMVTASQLLGALYFLTRMDVRLAAVLIFIMPVALLLSKSYMRRMRQLTRGIRSEESAVQAHIQESVQNRLLLRSLEYTPHSVSKLESLQRALLDKVMRYTDYSLFSRMMVQTGFAAGYVTAFLWGIFGIRSGDITFGMMTAFLQLVAQIQNPTVELSSEVPASQATRRNLSYVPQGNTLFSGTVRENLRMGNPEATDEEMTADIGCPQDGSRRRSSIDPLKNHRVNSADYERKHTLPFPGDRDLLSFPQQGDDLLEESVVADN